MDTIKTESNNSENINRVIKINDENGVEKSIAVFNATLNKSKYDFNVTCSVLDKELYLNALNTSETQIAIQTQFSDFIKEVNDLFNNLNYKINIK